MGVIHPQILLGIAKSPPRIELPRMPEGNLAKMSLSV